MTCVWAFSRVSGRTERDRVVERRSGVMRDTLEETIATLSMALALVQGHSGV
jgi:hypothetical protein